MKGKENLRSRKNNHTHRANQRSASYDRPHKKSVLSSIVYESSRNSLCSPRQSRTGLQFEHYIQYVTGGKVPTDIVTPRYSLNNRPKTSTPRRMSVCLMEQGRRSVAKENASKDMIKQGCKTPRDKNKSLFVKGSNIVKSQTSKYDVKKKKESSQKQIDTKRNSIKQEGKKPSKVEDKIEDKQKRLKQKLFAGIQFHRQLGRGAHALVKCGVDFTKQRKIAVKIYQKKELSGQQLKSIEREVDILGSLDHPGIIKLYEIIETFKTINLILEYGGGNSLEQYIRNRPSGRLEQKQAKNIFREILSAVSYLHRKGVAHRDIKTDNILLNKKLQVKIIDFGFSYKETIGENTATIFCGTPTYMAPQIVMKKSHCPKLADRWALGVLLYTILHGHCPFKAHNQKQLFQRILEHEFEFQEHISEGAKQIIVSLLSVSPEERPSPDQLLEHSWLCQK